MNFDDYLKIDPIGAAATHFSRWADSEVCRERSSVADGVITLRDKQGNLLIQYQIEDETGIMPLPPKVETRVSTVRFTMPDHGYDRPPHSATLAIVPDGQECGAMSETFKWIMDVIGRCGGTVHYESVVFDVQSPREDEK